MTFSKIEKLKIGKLLLKIKSRPIKTPRKSLSLSCILSLFLSFLNNFFILSHYLSLFFSHLWFDFMLSFILSVYLSVHPLVRLSFLCYILMTWKMEEFLYLSLFHISISLHLLTVSLSCMYVTPFPFHRTLWITSRVFQY